MKEQNFVGWEDNVNEIMEIIEEIKQRVKEKNKEINLLKNKNPSIENLFSSKKNFQLHIVLESSIANKLKIDANERKISLSELVRQKLQEEDKLNVIERKLDLLLKR